MQIVSRSRGTSGLMDRRRGAGSSRIWWKSSATDFDVFGADFGARFEVFDRQWADLREWVGSGSVGDRDLHPWSHVLDGPTLMLAGWRGMFPEDEVLQLAAAAST